MTDQASSPRVFLYLSRLLLVTSGNNLFFSRVSIGSHFDNTSYNMHLLFLHKYPNESVSDGSTEKHEDFLFICFTKKLIYPKWQQVKQLSLADSHGPCLPAHPIHFSFPLPLSLLLPLPLFLFLPFLPLFKTESQCVAQGDLELNNPPTSAPILRLEVFPTTPRKQKSISKADFIK